MSESVASAVTPTWVPADASSAMEFAVASESVTADTSASSTSETLMEKVSWDVEPSVEVAVTVISMEPSVSASNEAPEATVTVPSAATSKRASSTA
ncbi:hypothetical protein LP7551_02305 [Roseibium album]|nr:hypothetical protein LP7551_02305 [Roseibium album]